MKLQLMERCAPLHLKQTEVIVPNFAVKTHDLFYANNSARAATIPNEGSPKGPEKLAFGAKSKSFRHNKTNCSRERPDLGQFDNTS